MTERIFSADGLYCARDGRKSVICPTMKIGPRPAAFVLNMNFSTVTRMLREGLYTYSPTGPFFKKKKGAKCPK